MTGWIFQATPKEFDIDGFLRASPASAKWRATAKGIDAITTGDQIFVWRAVGGGDSNIAGVVAEASAVGSVIVGIDDSPAATFWLDRAAASRPEPRVEIKLRRYAGRDGLVPRDKLLTDPVMRDSAIIKARAGSNFRLPEEQQDRLGRLWDDGKRPWTAADLVDALASYGRSDGAAELAMRQGRYLDDARRKLSAFQACDPRSTYKVAHPAAELLSAWDSVFGAARSAGAALSN